MIKSVQRSLTLDISSTYSRNSVSLTHRPLIMVKYCYYNTQNIFLDIALLWTVTVSNVYDTYIIFMVRFNQ